MPKKKTVARTYTQMYNALSLNNREIVNEKCIAAVIKLSDADGRSRMGTKGFLQARLIQLITDMKLEGNRVAFRRFGAAVKEHARNHPPPATRTDPEMAGMARI